MSQSVTTTINPNSVTGTELATIIDDNTDANLTSNAGSARPPYAQAGTLWLDNSSSAEHVLYIFDGAVDYPVYRFNVDTGAPIIPDAYLKSGDGTAENEIADGVTVTGAGDTTAKTMSTAGGLGIFINAVGAGQIVQFDAAGNYEKAFMEFARNAGVKMNFNGSTKVEATNGGATITGRATVTNGLTVSAGTTTLGGNTTVQGNLDATGNISIAGNPSAGNHLIDIDYYNNNMPPPPNTNLTRTVLWNGFVNDGVVTLSQSYNNFAFIVMTMGYWETGSVRTIVADTSTSLKYEYDTVDTNIVYLDFYSGIYIRVDNRKYSNTDKLLQVVGYK